MKTYEEERGFIEWARERGASYVKISKPDAGEIEVNFFPAGLYRQEEPPEEYDADIHRDYEEEIKRASMKLQAHSG